MCSHRVAIISDAHYHAVESDWGMQGANGLAPRSWHDSRRSTRVFNESHRALCAALDDIAAREIKLVVLLGDYSDDGQIQSVQAVSKLLHGHSARHCTRFFALPGNHDVSGETGRHHTKEFLTSDGTPQLVSSDANVRDAIFHKGMYCLGQPDGFAPMAAFGFMRAPDVLHWETPFGTSDDFQSRCYEAVSEDGKTRLTLTDASYLVEPVEGLWLMMIDANVYLPTGEGRCLTESTNAGWNALVKHKPFILDWMADVAARAQHFGKRLLTFSHYPVLDSYGDPEGAEARLFGQTNMAKRTPQERVAKLVSKTGIGVHFSGHLHVKRLAHVAGLSNVAVPSLVAYPAAYSIAETREASCHISDVRLDDVPSDPNLQSAYLAEAAHRCEPPHPALKAQSYGDFLRAHVDALVAHRYLVREWPPERAREVASSCLRDVAAWAGIQNLPTHLADIPTREIVVDWYALRAAGPLAVPDLGRRRCLEFKALLQSLPADEGPDHEDARGGFWALFLRRLGDFAAQSLKDVDIVSLPRIADDVHGKKASA